MEKTCTELYIRRGAMPRLAMIRESLWKPGEKIEISFMGGNNYQREATMSYMTDWLDFANLTMEFLFDGEFGDVRVAFNKGLGSWSYVGKQCQFVAKTDPTMNLGWLDENTPDEEWERVVLHEAGHMLGAIHEHQSPSAGIDWDKKYVYNYYWRTQKWSKHQVDINIFDNYGKEVSNSEFDMDSIMLYPIPPEFTRDGFTTGWNKVLSETDMEYMERIYP